MFQLLLIYTSWKCVQHDDIRARITFQCKLKSFSVITSLLRLGRKHRQSTCLLFYVMGSSPLQHQKMDLQIAEKKWTSDQRYPDPKSRVHLSWKNQPSIHINQETKCQTHITVEYSLNGEPSSPVLTIIEPLDTMGYELWHVVVQSLSCVWLFCDPMDCSMPGFCILHHFPELAQSHVHWVGDAIQPSGPLWSPSPFAFNLFPVSGSFIMSQLFTSGGQSTGASASASVLPMNTQDLSPLGWTGWIS